jgi:hypothetical protein
LRCLSAPKSEREESRVKEALRLCLCRLLRLADADAEEVEVASSRKEGSEDLLEFVEGERREGRATMGSEPLFIYEKETKQRQHRRKPEEKKKERKTHD